MSRRVVWGVLILVAVAAAAGAWFELYAGRTLPAKVLSDSTFSGSHWAWTLDFSDLQPPEEISVLIERSSTPRPKGSKAGPLISQAEVPRALVERTVSAATFGFDAKAEIPAPDSGRLSIEIVDLSRFDEGATTQPSTTPKQFRLLATFAIGGFSAGLTGADTHLADGNLDGSVRYNAPEWKHGRLKLLQFYIRGADRDYRYDVVVQRRPRLEPRLKR